MAVQKEDIKLLDGKDIYDTSNEKYVLSRDFEKIIVSPEYKILGFLNDYIYSSSGEYLVKSNINGKDIAEVKLNIDHASFYEGLSIFYAYIDNILYQVSENLEIKWSKSFQSNIQDVVVDGLGNLYIIFESSRAIRKFLKDGTDLLYIDNSDDVTKTVKLYKQFITKGGGWLYILGSQYWDYDNKVEVFIDKYDTRKGIKIERQIIDYNSNVSTEDPLYEFINFYIKGDYIYIYGKQYIRKINIKGIEMWTYLTEYDTISESFNDLKRISYSDNTFEEYLYFVEDLYNTNGHVFGKLQLNGRELWKFTMQESLKSADFNICIYKDKIYTTAKTTLKFKSSYVLALDDQKVLFRIKDGSLVELVEYDNKELNSSDNYYGKYLLGDKIKEGIDKIVYVPLLHDTGDIINEDSDVLLLPVENEHFNDPENYDTFQLVSSQYTLTPNKNSILSSKNGKFLSTKSKNIFKTKEAYSPELVYDYILTKEGNRLDTMDNKDLIRARYQYAFNKKLLADRNKFFDYIMSKSDDYIITKKHGHRIVKKTREIYKYVLSKYSDINLIREWLLQNGLMKTLLPKYVDELRHHTVSMINDIQIAGTPTIYDIKPTKVFSYTFDGLEYPIRTWGTQIFTCVNLPFDKRRCQNRIYIDSIANLVKNKDIRPFIVFLNGKAIPWSKCTIIRDWSYTYLMIKDTNPYETNLECILFPCLIRYGEDSNILDSEEFPHFYFDENGNLTETVSNIKTRIEIIDQNVIGETIAYDEKYIEVKNNYNQLASEKNIFVFEDNALFSDSRFYIQEQGKDVFTYLRDPKDTVFKTFYYIKANPYYGLLYKIPNGSETKNQMVNKAQDNDIPSLYDNFMPPFDFKLYRTKPYDVNIANAVEYIMNYDMSLLIQYYKDQSNLKSYTFTGEELIRRIPDDGGYLVMPRCRRNGLDDYVIVFKNNELYEYNKQIEYSTKDFKIPIFNHVKMDDIIEILHFQNVDNSYYTLTIDSDPDYLPSYLRYDNFLLFGNSPSGKPIYDKFSVENSIQYDIDFTYKNRFNEKGQYIDSKIELKDKYYMNKSINMCSKRQFRHMYYNIYSERNSFNLSPDFRFCHLKNHYLVFVNGKRLESSEWVLNIMDNNNPNLKYINITTNNNLVLGDYIEIFYLPDAFEEISVSNTDSKRYGDICIDMEDLGYSFDKDLFMIFVNGQKINYNFIDNINNHRIRIKNDITSNSANNIIQNITVLKFLQPDELLGKLWSYSDQWSNATDALTPYQYHLLLTNQIKK